MLKQLLGKRVGICLSAGFFGFYHHAGVLHALIESGVRPVQLTGTSAGAIVAALYASGRSPKEIAQQMLTIRRSDFWDVQPLISRAGFGLLAGRRFRHILHRQLAVERFDACRVPLAVGAFNVRSRAVEHISQGKLVPAVYASCALPVMFTPGTIGKKRYLDGGCVERTPLAPFWQAEQPLDVVIVSYLPQKRSGTDQRRLSRDRQSFAQLKKHGIVSVVLTPTPTRLGPFSLHRAAAAMEEARQATHALLQRDFAQLPSAIF